MQSIGLNFFANSSCISLDLSTAFSLEKYASTQPRAPLLLLLTHAICEWLSLIHPNVIQFLRISIFPNFAHLLQWQGCMGKYYLKKYSIKIFDTFKKINLFSYIFVTHSNDELRRIELDNVASRNLHRNLEGDTWAPAIDFTIYKTNK